MAASAFIVNQPETTGRTIKEDVTSVLVSAQDADQAKELAKAIFSADSDQLWASATPDTVTAPTTFEGFTVTVSVIDPAGVEDDIVATYTGDSNDAWTDLMTGIVAALNATDEIANASYGGTRTLTIATGSGGDDLGDRKVDVSLVAPNGAELKAGYVGTITDEGAADAALSCQFNDVLGSVPKVIKKFA